MVRHILLNGFCVVQSQNHERSSLDRFAVRLQMESRANCSLRKLASILPVTHPTFQVYCAITPFVVKLERQPEQGLDPEVVRPS